MTRAFFRNVAVAALMLAATHAEAAHAGLTVGAIRWDPWYEAAGGAERVPMEASLGPSLWQGRAPSCATATSTYTISYQNCNTQAQIDSEITAAHNAKIDYWAYLWYGPTHAMQNAWNLHQSSTIKSNMNWCLMFQNYTLFESEVGSIQTTLTGYLQQSNYQTVLSGRPLVYLYSDGTSNATLATSITAFRSAVTGAGVANPYIVLVVGATSGAVSATGADAITVYATSLSGAVAGPYSALVTAAETYWTTMTATGQSIIPTAMTGADRRPRIERPVPWEVATQKPFVGDTLYYVAGTASAIAAHVGDMVTWMNANAASNPSRSGLIYSWDEHDEGGSTLNPSLGGGSAILTAVGGAL